MNSTSAEQIARYLVDIAQSTAPSIVQSGNKLVIDQGGTKIELPRFRSQLGREQIARFR